MISAERIAAQLFVERERTERLLLARHKGGNCYPPHCPVCHGEETPDGRKIEKGSWLWHFYKSEGLPFMKSLAERGYRCGLCGSPATGFTTPPGKNPGTSTIAICHDCWLRMTAQGNVGAGNTNEGLCREGSHALP